MFDLDKKSCTDRWVAVPGFDGVYEISSSGQVRSICTAIRRTSMLLNPVLRDDGYRQVTLYRKGRPHVWLLHRLVLFSFIGKAPEGMECAHLDGDKKNNCVGNLAWVTPAENSSHKVAHGTAGLGERNPMAKVNDEIVREIRRDYRRGSRSANCCALGKKYGITYQTVWSIVKGHLWPHII